MKKLKGFFAIVLAVAIISAAGLFIFKIKSDKRKELNESMVTLSENSFVYDGLEKRPEVTISLNGEILSQDNYVVSYIDNVNIGTAYAIISATDKSEKIKGSVIVGFEIVEGENEIVADLDFGEVVFDGQNKTPVIELSDYRENVDYTISWFYKSYLDDDFTPMTESTFINAGIYKVIISGKGDFSGCVIETFEIKRIEVEKPTISGSYVYNGNLQTATLSYESDLFTLQNEKQTNAGEYDVVVSLKDKVNYIWKDASNEDITLKFNISKRLIESGVMTLEYSQVEYSKTENRPTATITYNGMTLENEIDYNVAYSNNINVGTATAVAYGYGNYTGSISSTFEILPCKVVNPEIKGVYPYNGLEQTVELSYESDLFVVSNNKATNIGEYFALISLVDKVNYIWENSETVEDLTLRFEIIAKNIENLTLSIEYTSAKYTGVEIKPTATLLDGQTTLVLDENYSVAYSNNINAGMATVTVTGVGNYIGTKTATFEIEKCEVEIPEVKGMYVYNGLEQTIELSYESNLFVVSNNKQTEVGVYEIIVSLKDRNNYEWSNGSAENITLEFRIFAKEISNLDIEIEYESVKYSGNENKPTVLLTYEGEQLQENVHFKVNYKNNVNAGTASIEIIGMGNYTFYNLKTFEILKAEIETPTIVGTYIYNGEEQTARLSNENDLFMIQNEKQTNAGEYDVVVSLKDKANYTWKNGSSDDITLKFNISKRLIEICLVELEYSQVEYSKTELKPVVTVTLDGLTLENEIDYNVSYSNNVNVGTASVTVTGNGNYSGSVNVSFEILPKKVANPEVKGVYCYSGLEQTIKLSYESELFVVSNNKATNIGEYFAVVSLKDKTNYVWEDSETAEDISLRFEIVAKTLENLTLFLEYNLAEYTGEEIKPLPRLLDGGTILLLNEDYFVSYSNNINAGTATVTVTGKGNYGGTKTTTFRIDKRVVEAPRIIGTYGYNGLEQTANLSYESELFVVSNNKGTEVGKYELKVSLVDSQNYKWSNGSSEDLTLKFEILAKNILNLDIEIEYDSVEYSGTAHTPVVTIIQEGNSLKLNKDYTVSYSDNILIGTAIVTVTGKGNYTGTKVLTFEIMLKSTYVESEEYITNLFNPSKQYSSSYSLSSYYPLLTENQTDSNLCWIYSSLKALESSLMVQKNEYHNFSEIGSAYLYYKYVTQNTNKENKLINTYGNFKEFNALTQNFGLVYENSFSNDIYFDISEENYNNYSYVLNYVDTKLMKDIRPINIHADPFFKRLTKAEKIQVIKEYIMTYGGIFSGVEEGIISSSMYVKTTDPVYSESDMKVYNQSICIIGWNESKQAFLAINSKGVAKYDYSTFYIPYDYDYLYTDLYGYICLDENTSYFGSITSTSGGDDGLSSKLNPNYIGQSNLFVYGETLQLSYTLLNVSNLDNVSVVVYKGLKDATNQFTITFDNNAKVVTILSKSPSNLGEGYLIKFLESGNVIGYKDFYVFTGTEVSYIELRHSDGMQTLDSKLFQNTFASGNYTQTYYVNNSTYTNYELNMYLANFGNFTKSNINALNIQTYSLVDNGSGTASFVSDNQISAKFESTGTTTNLFRIYIKNLASDNSGKAFMVQAVLESKITGATATYTFIFFVSKQTDITTSHSNKIVYELNGGENSIYNINRYPHYEYETDIDMIDYPLFAPTKQNAVFAGWYLDKDFTIKITEINEDIVQLFGGSKDIVIYAKWE